MADYFLFSAEKNHESVSLCTAQEDQVVGLIYWVTLPNETLRFLFTGSCPTFLFNLIALKNIYLWFLRYTFLTIQQWDVIVICGFSFESVLPTCAARCLWCRGVYLQRWGNRFQRHSCLQGITNTGVPWGVWIIKRRCVWRQSDWSSTSSWVGLREETSGDDGPPSEV